MSLVYIKSRFLFTSTVLYMPVAEAMAGDAQPHVLMAAFSRLQVNNISIPPSGRAIHLFVRFWSSPTGSFNHHILLIKHLTVKGFFPPTIFFKGKNLTQYPKDILKVIKILSSSRYGNISIKCSTKSSKFKKILPDRWWHNG